MATDYSSLVQNPEGIYTNPVSTSGAKVTDEFIDPPSTEKNNRALGAPYAKNKQSTQEFFDTLYTSPIPVDQNSYEAATGFLVKKGFSLQTAQPIAHQLMAIAYYSKKPIWYWLDELDLLPDSTEINFKILQILNLSNGGNYYLGIKDRKPVNAYVSRLLIK